MVACAAAKSLVPIKALLKPNCIRSRALAFIDIKRTETELNSHLHYNQKNEVISIQHQEMG